MLKRISITIVVMLLMAMSGWSKAIDDAKALYNDGKYDDAIAKLSAIIKSSPKDGTANYYLGLSYLGKGDTHSALSPLQKAEDRGIADASKRLAEIAMDEYRLDAASSHIATWEKQLAKSKKPVPDELDEMRSRVVMMKNMLQRVEKIAIIDSIVVDKSDFFKYYKLAPDAGKLIDGKILSRDYAPVPPAVVYVPQSNREVFWAMPDAQGVLSLYSAQVLDDGTLEGPQPLGSNLNEGGDADFPYVASDGLTFYFANTGDNSLGGYDIFMSRRSGDGSVFNPQNMGMPYNSPYDDYMLVIDEYNHRGWWATDRNQIPGKVTIYEFVPNETRVNYDPDDPDIASYAMVKSIAATTEGMVVPDAGAVRATNAADDAEAEFVLPMGKGKIYTNLDDFRNPKARSAMQECVARQKDMDMMQAQMQVMRRQYAGGDSSVGNDILSLEKRLIAAKNIVKKLRNQAIAKERGLAM